MSALFDLDESATSSLSEDGRYRYDLTRRWANGDLMLWIMLNPSTADAATDDPTIRRCTGFAKREDAAGIAVVNLYALRSTDPRLLLCADDPIGPDNKATTCSWLARDDISTVVAAWGAWWTNTPAERRIPRLNVEQLVADSGRELLCLGRRSKYGAPRHPLYVASRDPLVAYLATWETT